MTEPKTIAGLHCLDVLDLLDDYVAGALEHEVLARVNEHLAGCAACASFGGRYASLVEALHASLASGDDETDAVALAKQLWRAHNE